MAFFFSPTENCAKGFGLCRLINADSTEVQRQVEKTGKKVYKSILTLSTKGDRDVLKIEFSEKIPNFRDTFVVEKADTLKNVLQHEYIYPIDGKYTSNAPNDGMKGSVEIFVKKGKKKTEYKPL